MKNTYLKKFIKSKIFSVKPKLKLRLVYLIPLIIIIAIGAISYSYRLRTLSENVIKPITSISPTVTPSPTKNLYQTISELKPNTIIEIKKVAGNFADVDIHIKGDGGYHLYAMNNNGQWKIIWEGNGDKYAGECQDLVNKYNIPKEFLDCNWTPTPFYATTELNRCVIVFPDKKATTKSCLSNNIPDIRIAGEQCDKPLVDYVKCRDDYVKNNCTDEAIAAKCSNLSGTENQSCVIQNRASCGGNTATACPYPNIDKEKQAYLDLVSKYCKDI